MWITAVLGMATKFAEVTLAQEYRATGDAGVAGGPMYYIEKGLGASWKPLAIFFALALGLTAFLTGNGVQANTVADTMGSSFGVPAWVTGLVAAGVVGGVVLGGIKRIGRVTSILAPAMAGLYVTGAVVILLLNAGEIGPAFSLIFSEAFEPTAGVAGTGVGAVLVTAMWGVKRGLFSNEAGQGSAPIAHAAAKTDEPVSEGVVALLEPFIDTILICTMTAMVIITTGVWKDRIPTEMPIGNGDMTWVAVQEDGTFEAVEEAPAKIHVEAGTSEGPNVAWHDAPVPLLYIDEAQTQPFSGTLQPGANTAVATDGTAYAALYGDAAESGAPLTMLAFKRGLAPVIDFGDKIVLLCVLLFGISTAISWSYYGDRCANYVFGARAVGPYRAAFVLMHFLGAVAPLSLAWTLGDVFMGVVIIPNLIALVLLSPKLATMTRDYFERKPWRR